jgi:hypothetical protein
MLVILDLSSSEGIKSKITTLTGVVPQHWLTMSLILRSCQRDSHQWPGTRGRLPGRWANGG